MNFFKHQCYLHAKVPRVDLGNGKYRLVKTPWEGLSNVFSLLLLAMLMELARLMPVRQMSNLCSLTEHRLWALMKRYTTLARAQVDFSALTRIGVDETIVRRGHDYVSLLVDVEEHRTLYVAKGRDHQVLQGFCADLHEHNASLEQIKQVSYDISPAFIKGVQENLPDASIVFDRFHVVQIVNEAMDKVRKEEVRDNPLLKGSKYIFLCKPENLTDWQLAQLDGFILPGLNLKTLKACHIKESFQEIYTACSPRFLEKPLKKWYYWASHYRLTPMVKAAKTIKRYWDGILNWATKKISNGILEG
jgi:transposase